MKLLHKIIAQIRVSILLGRMNDSIKECDNIYKWLEDNKLLDEQMTLNWLDTLNEITTRH